MVSLLNSWKLERHETALDQEQLIMTEPKLNAEFTFSDSIASASPNPAATIDYTRTLRREINGKRAGKRTWRAMPTESLDSSPHTSPQLSQSESSSLLKLLSA
jgi:hypothetical protein